MLSVSLAVLLAPAFAAGPVDRVMAVPDLALPGAPLVRLVVEAVPDAHGYVSFDADQRAAVALAVEEAAGGARVLSERGSAQTLLEAHAAAAPKLQQDLETLGLRVSRLDVLAANMRSTQRALSIGTDDELSAAAGRLMDNARHSSGQSEDAGALLTAVETADVSRLSNEARRAAARAIHTRLRGLLDAHDAITDDQRVAARRAWIAAHPGQAAGADAEYFAQAELQKPRHRAQTEGLRMAVSRGAAAIQKLDADVSTPLLTELLTRAGHAVLEDLAKDDRRAVAYVRSYMQMLRSGVAQTADLVEEYALSTDERRRKDIRLVTSSGGVAGSDIPKVDGSRASVWAYDKAAFYYQLGDMRGTFWPLLGVSRAAAQAVKDSFVDLLVAAEPEIKRVDDAARLEYMERERRGFDDNTSDLSADPRLDKLRDDYMRQAEKRYEDHHKVEGDMIVDRSLQAASFLSSFDLLKPGWSTGQYVELVAQILRDAAARSGPGTFKLVAQTSLRFAENTRQFAWTLIGSPARDQVEALEREVKARAAAEGLKLYP